ncbi:sugar ABC transporter permease [Nocardioides sp.]|uniref:carbohydrate ABC transporter permease n=1 Tax=Nocardioides sp. TaxID=35761 RepID=UPI002614C8C1|nr:sugar ABC transporter permease [Nocardioides sp.]MDI6910244.1 sugar ABC transporter permease [Nocardioides sp.]
MTATAGTPRRAGAGRSGAVVRPYLYLAPATIVLVVVFGYPVLRLLVESVTVPGILGETGHGLDNFRSVIDDPILRRALLNNLRLFLAVPVMTVVAVLLATLLHERIAGWRFYQSIVFVPYVLAIPVVGIIFSYVLQRHGLLNQSLGALGLDPLVHDWLGSSQLAIWSVWVVIVWQQVGFGVVLFLARLSSLDPGLIEAAMVDRAGWWRRFRHVVLPHLAPIIEFFVTLSLINMLSWVFNYVYVMTGGGPARSTYVTELVIYQQAFRDGLPNLAAAVSVILLVLATVLLSAQSLVRRRIERMES